MQKSRVRLSPHLIAQTQANPKTDHNQFFKIAGSLFLLAAMVLFVRHFTSGQSPASPSALPQGEQVLGVEKTSQSSDGYYLYDVQQGDSLFSISKKFQVKWGIIAELNGLREPFALETGQRLKLPSNTVTAQQQFYENLKNKIYIVSEGDSFVSVAQKVSVSVTDLLHANPELKSPDVLNVGQTLRLP